MKIAIASDLHFEFHKAQPGWLPSVAKSCEVIVLAGDIAVGDEAVTAVNRIADAHPESRVIWVAGNHEFYRCDIDRQIEKFRALSASRERVYFLENDTIVLDGITFIGCTLWSGFDMLGPENSVAAMREAGMAISDFSLIKQAGGREVFTPEYAAQKFCDSRAWLESELGGVDAERTVVITHFPPCREARNPYFKETLLSAYFQADCRQLIERFQPALWCYGHNHYSDDRLIGKTRIVSNQLGYPNELTQTNYNPEKAVDVYVQ